jgi:hypothetical protein
MKTIIITLSLLVTLTCNIKAQGAADKLERKTKGGVTGEALVSYGFDDVYKLGFGARLGTDNLISSQPNIYIGGVFAYHLGTSIDSPGGNTSTANVIYGGGDLGYNVLLEGNQVMIRPSVYIGVSSFKIGNLSDRNNEFMFAPGATVFFPVSDGIIVGADARFFVVSNASSFVLGATIGKSF